MRIPVLLTLWSSCLMAHQLPAQQSPALAATPTLHANAKLVVLDVVVTDHDHHPIHNLKQPDFTILEGHRQQTIKSFEEHTPPSAAEAAKLPPLPPLPAGTFSNYTPTPPNSALNVLLIDTLNTPATSQVFMRRQVLKYLQNAKPGSNIAIFGLSTDLVMLQGFTTDPEVLKAAALKLTGGLSPFLNASAGMGMHDSGDGKGQPPPAPPSTETTAALQLQAILDFVDSFEDTARIRTSLNGMNQLAHYLSAFPGRKNLVWLSGGFPLSISPDAVHPSIDPFVGMASSDQEYRETIRLFASSQIAVYPIDARGLMIGTGSVRKDMEQADAHSSMMQMAHDTGGRAAFNNNGLAQAVDTAIEDGSSYYTIAYRPTDAKEAGRFRTTEVKLAQSGCLLEYRHSYIEDDPNRAGAAETAANSPAPGSSLLIRAMIHGAPASSEMLFKARVLPTASASTSGQRRALASDGPPARYAIDFAVLPSDISYTTTPDGLRHFNLEFIALVYRPDGTLANRTGNILKGTLTPAQYAALQQNGFPNHLEIDVPAKSNFTIRLGVHDRSANRVGTIELPVATVSKLPAATIAGTSSPSTAPTPGPGESGRAK